MANNSEVAGSNPAPATRKCRSEARSPDGGRASESLWQRGGSRIRPDLVSLGGRGYQYMITLGTATLGSDESARCAGIRGLRCVIPAEQTTSLSLHAVLIGPDPDDLPHHGLRSIGGHRVVPEVNQQRRAVAEG